MSRSRGTSGFTKLCDFFWGVRFHVYDSGFWVKVSDLGFAFEGLRSEAKDLQRKISRLKA